MKKTRIITAPDIQELEQAIRTSLELSQLAQGYTKDSEISFDTAVQEMAQVMASKLDSVKITEPITNEPEL
jgi:hypothetical protein